MFICHGIGDRPLRTIVVTNDLKSELKGEKKYGKGSVIDMILVPLKRFYVLY